MKTSIDHIPPQKQREIARALSILHEEFEDALKESTADFKKRGRILKIILFGSYAKGGWVDEPFTMKGYRSDFDFLIVVNDRKLCDFAEYWYKAADRLNRDASIHTPVSFIVHSRREVNTHLKAGQYFFLDIRKEGILLYELDNEPLAEPQPLTPTEVLQAARRYFKRRFATATKYHKIARFCLSEGDFDEASFLLHQTLEQAYSCVLLTLTNYSPASHNLKFLRSLAEEQDRSLAKAFPRENHRERAVFNMLNEAYVKARYSEHFEISRESIVWIFERSTILLGIVQDVCCAHIDKLSEQAN